jgi:hypothetical protein
MKQIASLIIAILFFVCSCGLKNNSNKQANTNSEDSDLPADVYYAEEENQQKVNDCCFKFKYDIVKYDAVERKNDFFMRLNARMFLTTKDGKNYYTYDDEFDYSGNVYADFMIWNAIFNDAWQGKPSRMENIINKLSPYLLYVIDTPNYPKDIPNELKESFLKTHYDVIRNQKIYVGGKGYGFQKYKLGNYIIEYSRYSKQYLGWEDIPEGALMIQVYYN